MKNKKRLFIFFGFLFFLSFFFVKKTFSQYYYYYSCNQNCSGNPNGCNAPLICITGSPRSCRNPDCTTETDCTCPPGGWIKLKNASFISSNDLDNKIPDVVIPYDNDDNVRSPSDRLFIIADTNYDPGLVAAKSIQLYGALPSSRRWQTTLTKNGLMSPSGFLSYVKSRKEFGTFNSINEIGSQNNNNQILVADGGVTVGINDTNKTNFNNRNLVIVIEGNLNIDATTFTPTNASIAFIVTGTITFSNTTTQANGIFVASKISLGTTTNQGLKIVGNLSAATLINARKWTDSRKPSVFIIFNQSDFLNLLPYLSTSSYQWNQTQ
jgi:hypothetical protein